MLSEFWGWLLSVFGVAGGGGEWGSVAPTKSLLQGSSRREHLPPKGNATDYICNAQPKKTHKESVKISLAPLGATAFMTRLMGGQCRGRGGRADQQLATCIFKLALRAYRIWGFRVWLHAAMSSFAQTTSSHFILLLWAAAARESKLNVGGSCKAILISFKRRCKAWHLKHAAYSSTEK